MDNDPAEQDAPEQVQRRRALRALQCKSLKQQRQRRCTRAAANEQQDRANRRDRRSQWRSDQPVDSRTDRTGERHGQRRMHRHAEGGCDQEALGQPKSDRKVEPRASGVAERLHRRHCRTNDGDPGPITQLAFEARALHTKLLQNGLFRLWTSDPPPVRAAGRSATDRRVQTECDALPPRCGQVKKMADEVVGG